MSDPENGGSKAFFVDDGGVYKCVVPECGVSLYTRRGNYLRHWHEKHTKSVQRYMCPRADCETNGSSPWELRRHLRDRHHMNYERAEKTYIERGMVANRSYISPKSMRGPFIRKRKNEFKSKPYIHAKKEKRDEKKSHKKETSKRSEEKRTEEKRSVSQKSEARTVTPPVQEKASATKKSEVTEKKAGTAG